MDEYKVAKIFLWITAIVTGGFFIAFNVALIISERHRTWDRAPGYIIFGLIFIASVARLIAISKNNK